MSSTIKIATLNLCLGLKNKKETLKRLIRENDIDIMCMQETDIEVDFPSELLAFKGFAYENEQNDVKSRCGIYVSNKISYVRRCDIEIVNKHIIVIDLNDSNETRIIALYRPFNPLGLTQRQFFESQVILLNNIINQNTILLGDFNLDHSKKYDIGYSHKHYFNILNDAFSQHSLHQLVDFNTWSRVINNNLTSSILDHVYLKDITLITNLSAITPPFGDHLLISFETKSTKLKSKPIYKRNYQKYSKDVLIQELSKVDWKIPFDSVQAYWNCFESKLIEVVDNIAPPELANSLQSNSKSSQPPHIRNKINKRARLLKKCSTNPNNCLNTRQEIKTLNKEIKSHFHKLKTNNVRRGIVPGSSKSLWDAVNKAKDCNTNSIPDTLFLNGNKVSQNDQAQVFATYFSNKVKIIASEATIDENVFNGTKKVTCLPSPFMSCDNILECLKDIKPKNCEGYDRIPQRILTDGAEILINPLKSLFDKIYTQKTIPEQWSIAKVIPIHKKGPKNNVENYRPIANLCSTSKVFEKLILKHLSKIEALQNTDITGKHQHGFKKNHSTSTLALQLQSLIARALDEDNYVAMASLDLSAAFDVVNTELLLTRLRVLGLPEDVVGLLEVWLKNRLFYVQISDLNSLFIEINSGTIQGSILGPILYAIFVAPLYEISKLSNFADDNFAITKHQSKAICMQLIEYKMKTISKWLKDSGLKVNETKTELCLFYRKDTPQIEITINNVLVKSKDHMNVLGVIFDSKLSWAKHVATQANKANSALHAIKLIRKYFTQDEIIKLLTSNFYSILFYNSEVWHIPTLKPELKQIILSTSAHALKLSQRTPNFYESFIDVHKSCKRAHPNQILIYKHAILLHKMYNSNCPQMDWIELNFNQTLTSRQTLFISIKSNRFHVGNNLLVSRLSVLNNKIPLNDLNMSLASFKIKYKEKFLSTAP